MAPFPGAQVKLKISKLRVLPEVLPQTPSQLAENLYSIFFSKVAVTPKTLILHVPGSNIDLYILDLTL